MKYLKFILVLHSLMSTLCSLEVSKEGLIPFFAPDHLGSVMLFLPYNCNAILVGDRIAHTANHFAQDKECSTVFCFSPEETDLQLLNEFSQIRPNIHVFFGLLDTQPEGIYPYFSTKLQNQSYEDGFKFPGSLLPPLRCKGIRMPIDLLFGEERSLPTFSLAKFCEEKNLSKVHFLLLNTGGTELEILQNNPEIVNNAIGVSIRTYHQPIRENLSSFEGINQFMKSYDFELMSHHIYDHVIGQALYVKKRYISAVFRSKEL